MKIHFKKSKNTQHKLLTHQYWSWACFFAIWIPNSPVRDQHFCCPVPAIRNSSMPSDPNDHPGQHRRRKRTTWNYWIHRNWIQCWKIEEEENWIVIGVNIRSIAAGCFSFVYFDSTAFFLMQLQKKVTNISWSCKTEVVLRVKRSYIF